MNEDLINGILGIVFYIVIPFGTILVGLVVGSRIEKRHFESLREREEALLNLPTVSARFNDPDQPVAESHMVIGSCVVSIDYFKRLLGGLRNVFGGRIRSYESVLDRSRREAILRMKEQAPNADIIVNFRIETSSIGSTQQSRKRGLGAIETLAYGTAIRYGAPGTPPPIPTPIPPAA